MRESLYIFAAVVLFALLAWLLFGCLPDRDGCSVPGAMRCDDNIAQICTGDGVWMDDDDCDAVPQWDGPPERWKCCVDDGEAICVDVEVCQ